MKDIKIAITAASYSGNKGAAAMLQSSISQLYQKYGDHLFINLMSVYPVKDREQIEPLPWDFIKVIPAPPEKLLFLAFPLAVLHRVFGWCPPVRKLTEKNRILRAYKNTDLVIDEAGISFVDSRGFVMNTYAFVCMAVPLLMGVPVVKYSQALGTFHNPYNRFLAKWILPKLKLICARGEITYENLKSIGITQNVRLCADGAFSMEDSAYWKEAVESVCGRDRFFERPVVGLSVSSVVEKKCSKKNIDYCGIMREFIGYLNKKGYGALLIANAARLGSEKPRNNDLLVGDRIYESLPDQEMARWYHEEMTPEQIREYIAKCRFLVASRFHAMVGALEKQVPVLLIGWSHKYKEVLDMFELGQYAVDFSNLGLCGLQEGFEKLEQDEDNVRKLLARNADKVMASSRENIELISKEIDRVTADEKPSKGLLDLKHPEQYIGEHISCQRGYAADERIRSNAASGGMVTALLCSLLEKGEIDGAWVTKTRFTDGRLTYDTYIATTAEEIKAASSSVYMQIPMLSHLDMVRSFEGRVAVVMVPCMMKALNQVLEKEPALKQKVVLKLGLYCSGCHDVRATEMPLKKLGLDLSGAERLYYRRGHWRGQGSVIFRDGSEKSFSYGKTICAYKNAYFFLKDSCMLCKDQYAQEADISFGDIWLKEMKKEDIKYTSCIIRTQTGKRLWETARSSGAVRACKMTDADVVRSQKRALVFKYNCLPAKKKYLSASGGAEGGRCKWNHKLAAYLAVKDMKFSREAPEKLEKIPMKLVYYYMCFIRVLLSF